MYHSPTAATTTDVNNPITVMKRYELKYLLNPQQRAALLGAMEGRMAPDSFGLTSIASLYYDTPDYRLIRASLEQPMFKEKLRLRAYGLATDTSPVFLELKRKAYGLVYKRRVKTTLPQVEKFFAREGDICAGGQINREIVTFRNYYNRLVPACMIIYDRTAYVDLEGDLRLTIDGAPRYRTDRLDLTRDMEGIPLLPPGWSILEVKVQSALPLWLASALSDAKIYKTSFSKYGEAYRQQLLKLQPVCG